MTPLQKHDIALGWLMVRRRSLEAGREEILRQTTAQGASKYWEDALRDQDRKLANLDDSAFTLQLDGGYVDLTGAIEDGNTINGEIDDDPTDDELASHGVLIDPTDPVPSSSYTLYPKGGAA